jgi:signal transduction histidine kinase
MGANFVLQTTAEDETTARSRRVLGAILRSCKQMERLIRDFGDLSEIEGDAVELRTGVHDAGQMLEIAAEAARPGALTRKIEINSNCLEGILFTADRDRLLRALGHVIDNAVRFSPEGSVVTVAVQSEGHNGGGKVRFVVTDHGPGISDEVLAHLYDRTWHSKRPGRTGSGLGLAIVRGIVTAHGGTIELDTKEGGPTTFTLVLPRDAAPSDAIDEPDIAKH